MAAPGKTPLIPKDEPAKPRDKTGAAPAVARPGKPGTKERQKLPWTAVIGGLLVISALIWGVITYMRLPPEVEVKKSKKR